MKNLTYYRPKTSEEAVGLLDSKWGTAELLAGGTDLLDLQKEYVAQPDKVVSLSGIANLRQIVATPSIVKTSATEVSSGAGATLADIAQDSWLRELFPALTAAAGDIGGPQI